MPGKQGSNNLDIKYSFKRKEVLEEGGGKTAPHPTTTLYTGSRGGRCTISGAAVPADIRCRGWAEAGYRLGDKDRFVGVGNRPKFRNHHFHLIVRRPERRHHTGQALVSTCDAHAVPNPLSPPPSRLPNVCRKTRMLTTGARRA